MPRLTLTIDEQTAAAIDTEATRAHSTRAQMAQVLLLGALLTLQGRRAGGTIASARLSPEARQARAQAAARARWTKRRETPEG